VPGTNGQLLYNNSGNLSAEDPVVSGPDATGAAQTKNPVAGLAGIDYGVGCGGAACVREAKVDSSGDLYTQTTLTGSWPYSGALGTVGLTGTLPAFASTPAVSLTGSWPYSGALGTVSLTGTLPAFTSIPYVKGYPDTTTASYHASTNVVSAASATDIAVLPGNATNTVLVTRVIVSCTQTTAGIITIQLIKRSVADTSGTSSNMTVVPDDSGYSAGSSVPKIYTANPTTGTAVGNLDTALIGCMASGTATPNDIYIFRPLKPIILRGTAQQLAVNLNGATVTGGSFDVTFEYEETTTP